MRGKKLISVIDFEEVKLLLATVARHYQGVRGQQNGMTAAPRSAEAKKLHGTLEASAGLLQEIIDLLRDAKEYDEHLRVIIGDVVQADIAAEDACANETDIVTDENKFLAELDRIAKKRDPIDRVAAYAHLVGLAQVALETADHRKKKLEEFLGKSKSDKSDETANQRSNAKTRIAAVEASVLSIRTRERTARELAEQQKRRVETKLARAASPLEKERMCG